MEVIQRLVQKGLTFFYAPKSYENQSLIIKKLEKEFPKIPFYKVNINKISEYTLLTLYRYFKSTFPILVIKNGKQEEIENFNEDNQVCYERIKTSIPLR